MTATAYINPTAGPVRTVETQPPPALQVAALLPTAGMLCTQRVQLPFLGQRMAPTSAVVPLVPAPAAPAGRRVGVFFPAVYSRAKIRRPSTGQLWPRTR